MLRRAAFVLPLLLLVACHDDNAPKDGAPASPPKEGAPKSSPAGGYGYGANLGDDVDRKAGDAIQKGKKFLLEKREGGGATWGSDDATRVGYTALAALALVAATPAEKVATDPTILAALDAIVAAQKENGSIFGNPAFVNYETSAALAALAAARAGPKYGAAQAKARDFIAASQIAGDENALSFGGFPYKKDATSDLSNLQFAVRALHDAGLPADSPVFARVQKYLTRVQNRSESNPAVVPSKEGDAPVEVVSGDDGGGVYAPGDSKAGRVKRADGKWEAKSYGSMTYALLQCLLYAGVKADDPRVVAALGWISKHFVLDRNPGFEAAKDPEKAGKQGYYYYLRTMARALAELEKASGKKVTVTDAAGKAHDWRREVAEALVAHQKPDGSWVNDADRWNEGDPRIVTSYAIETLATCQGRLP